MIVAAIPPDIITLVAALFLLIGVPAILFAGLLLYTGYVRYDAEQYLEALENAEREADENQPPLEADGDESTGTRDADS